MAATTLRREEQVGLILAVALHMALIWALLLRPAIMPPPVPQRISVTLSPDVGPNATAPTHEDAAADLAPTLGALPPAAAPAPAPAPPEVLKPVTPPPAKVTAPPVAKPISRPAVVPPPPAKVTLPRHHAAKPQDTPPAPQAPAAKAAARHVPSVKDWSLTMPTAADQPVGGSRIGNDFLKGLAGGKSSGKAQRQGAAVIGPQIRSALSGAIAQQLKPHWVAPEGVDADKIVTILSWNLNRDGSLAGSPQVVRQEGITDSNRPQAARHAEQAIRAVQLAAPFKLPAEYYNLWKHVGSFEFNRTLSQ